jgi:hypothetical protein
MLPTCSSMTGHTSTGAYPFSTYRGTAHPDWWPISISLAPTQKPGSHPYLGCLTRPNREIVGHALGAYKYSSSLRSQVFYYHFLPLLFVFSTDLSVGVPAGTNPPPLSFHRPRRATDHQFNLLIQIRSVRHVVGHQFNLLIQVRSKSICNFGSEGYYFGSEGVGVGWVGNSIGDFDFVWILGHVSVTVLGCYFGYSRMDDFKGF